MLCLSSVPELDVFFRTDFVRFTLVIVSEEEQFVCTTDLFVFLSSFLFHLLDLSTGESSFFIILSLISAEHESNSWLTQTYVHLTLIQYDKACEF